MGSAAFVDTGDLADTAGTYDNTSSGLTASTIQDAIDELADNAGDYATKDGVEETLVNHTTITGTVPTVTAWGTDTPGTATVTASITAATYTEPAAQGGGGSGE